MIRVFADEITDGVAVISVGDTAHLKWALRVRIGDTIRVMFNGEQYDGIIQSIGNDICVTDLQPVEILSERLRVTLYQCIPKLNKMETIIQKSVELGVYKIVPTVSARCIAKADARKIDRWRKIVLEACKQCGRADVPEITTCLSIKRIENSHELLIVAYEEETEVSLKQILTGADAVDVGLIIGSEGGLAPDEVEYLTSVGGQTVSLGRRILRTETAGPAALAMLAYHFSE